MYDLISCLRAKPAAGGGTMTCAATGCDWLKQLKRFTAVLAFRFGRNKTVLKLFYFSFVSVLFHLCGQF